MAENDSYIKETISELVDYSLEVIEEDAQGEDYTTVLSMDVTINCDESARDEVVCKVKLERSILREQHDMWDKDEFEYEIGKFAVSLSDLEKNIDDIATGLKDKNVLDYAKRVDINIGKKSLTFEKCL